MATLVYLYLVAAVLVAIMAKIRGRRAIRWFLIALLITPLGGGLLVVALPRLQLPPPPRDIGATLTDCTIRVVRHAAFLDRLRPYVIFVNGVEVGSVARDSVVDFHVPSGKLVIEARVDWGGSPPLTIEVAPLHRIDIEVTNEWDPLSALWAMTFRSGSYLTLRQLTAADLSKAAA